MIKLSFVVGGALRRVNINGRIITFISQETGFTPINMDLDKLEASKKDITKKMGDEGLDLLKELTKLETEEQMANDIIKDFQESGWRLVKKEDGFK